MPKVCRVCQISKSVRKFKKNLEEEQGRHHTCNSCMSKLKLPTEVKYSAYMTDEEFDIYCKKLKRS